MRRRTGRVSAVAILQRERHEPQSGVLTVPQTEEMERETLRKTWVKAA